MQKITQLDHVQLTVNSCVNAPFDCDALNLLLFFSNLKSLLK